MDTVFVGKKLAELRKLKGRTQAELADQFGVTKQAISKWENGKSMPDILLLPDIAKYFNVEMGYFFEEKQPENQRKAVIKGKVAIAVDGLSKKYDGNENYTLDKLNLNIYKGVSTAIVGPSGCGKSTLLNCMAGLENTTAGSISICDHDITRLKEPKLTVFRRENINYIFQQYNLIESLNVVDNIKLPYKTAGKKIDKKKLKRLLHKLGLGGKEKFMPNKLSGGQQQRVAVASALLGDSNIIFADEPTGALDLKTGNDVLNLLLMGGKEFDSPIVIITHDVTVASKCDIVHFMLDGKIIKTIQNASVEEISNIMLRLTTHE